MKKMLIGFICGAVLMFSGQAFADQISRVGKKVGSEAIVFIEGKEVSSAIVVDGKAYTPARDIVETFGGTVNWVPGKGGNKNMIEIYRLPDGELVVTKEKQKELVSEIEQLRKSNEYFEKDFIPKFEEGLANRIPDTPAYHESAALLAEYKETLELNKKKLAELESELKVVEEKIKKMQGNQ